MGDIAGGVIGGAIGAVLATALWYGVVAITNWQVGIIAVAVGFIVGQGVVFGAGRHPSIALVPISVVFTLVSLVVSEYLIARHFLGIAAAEISAEFGVTIAEVGSAEFAASDRSSCSGSRSSPNRSPCCSGRSRAGRPSSSRCGQPRARTPDASPPEALPFRGTPPILPPKRNNRRNRGRRRVRPCVQSRLEPLTGRFRGARLVRRRCDASA